MPETKNRIPRPILIALASIASGAVLLYFIAEVEGGATHIGPFDVPGNADTDQARVFVQDAVGVALPKSVRAIFLSGGKTTIEIEPLALDSVESAIGLDSTWKAEEWGGGVNHTRLDTTESGVYEQLYQRWNNLYQITNFSR